MSDAVTRGYPARMGRVAWPVSVVAMCLVGCGGAFTASNEIDGEFDMDAHVADAISVGAHEPDAMTDAASGDVAAIDAGPDTEALALEAATDAIIWPGEDGGFRDAPAADAMAWFGRDASPVDSASPDSPSGADASPPPTIEASVPQDASPPCVPKNIAEACATGAGGLPALGGGYCGGSRPDGCGGEVDCSTNPCVTVNAGQTPETYYCGGGCAETCHDCCGAGCGVGCEAPTLCEILP